MIELPAKGKRKLVFDVPPEEHDEFMARAKAAGMSGIEYFRSMREPLPHFQHVTTVGVEREKYISFAVFFLELMYKSNGGLRTSALGLEDEWSSRLDKLEDCIKALRVLSIPTRNQDPDEVSIPPNPSWVKSRIDHSKFVTKRTTGDQE